MENVALVLSLVLLADAHSRLFVEMTALETLLKPFKGCDVILITEKVELSNLERIENPLVLYWDFEKREDHYFSYLQFGTPITIRGIMAHESDSDDQFAHFSLLRHQKIIKGIKCKVQVLLDVKAKRSGAFHEIPLSARLESAVVYTFFVHTMGSLDHQSQTEGTVEALYDRYYRPYIEKLKFEFSLRHVYLALVATGTPEPHNRQDLMISSLALAARDFSLITFCAYCDKSLGPMLTIVAESVNADWTRTANEVTDFTLNDLQRIPPDHSGKPQQISFTNLDKELSYTTANFDLVHEALQKESRRLKLEAYRFNFSPELLMCFEIQASYPNTTLRWLEPDLRNEIYRKCETDECIFGTGHFVNPPNIFQPLLIPTERVSLTFITHDNVTVTPSVVSFSTPFDAASWSFALGCSSVVAVILCLALRKTDHESRCLTAVSILWGIFIENFNDVSTKRRANLRAYAALTLITSLVGIVLSNGYKGVLTSYLSDPPSYSGPNDLEQVFAERWSFIPFTSAWNKFDKETNSGNFTEDLTKLRTVYDRMRRSAIFFLYIFFSPTRQLRNPNRDVSIEPHTDSQVFKATDALRLCNLTRAVLITPLSEIETVKDVDLPPSCSRLRKTKTFILSNKVLVPTTIGWSSYGDGREGTFFLALRRLVEAGIQMWLDKLWRQNGVKYKVTADFAVEPVQGEVPLSLGTPLVESTFKLWYRLLALATAVMFLEITCGICGSLFQWVPRSSKPMGTSVVRVEVRSCKGSGLT